MRKTGSSSARYEATSVMVITDQFVYLHMHKTGGTFVERVMDEVYAKADTLYYNTLHRADRERFGSVDQHETVQDIPAEHRHKRILFTIRNPYDCYVSRYEFAWWVGRPNSVFVDDKMQVEFPTYPRISSDAYMTAINNWD